MSKPDTLRMLQEINDLVSAEQMTGERLTRMKDEMADLRAQLEAVTRKRDIARKEWEMWLSLYNKATSERDAALERERRLRDHIKDALDLLEIETPFGAAEVLREAINN